MPVEVTKAYTAQYPDPIELKAGDVVRVAHSDSEYPDWFWSCGPSGKEGWVHRSFLAASIGMTTALDAYSAKELTVLGGERGKLIRMLDGWVYLRLDNGDEGWIPQSHVHLPNA